MYFNVFGLVIGSMNVRESDRYITLLTDSLGKIKVNVRSAMITKKGLAAATQLFAFSKFTLFENKGIYTANALEPICLFFGLASSLSRFSLASYFAELVDTVCYADMDCQIILRLLLSGLRVLEQQEGNEALIKAVFELKLISLCGFTPELQFCSACLKPPSAPCFHIFEGLVYCKSCCEKRNQTGEIVSLSSGALDAAKFILAEQPPKIFSFLLGGKSLCLLSDFCERYLIARLERSFQTLNFYKNCKE